MSDTGGVDAAGVDGRGRRIETPDRFAGDDGRADPRWEWAYADPALVEGLLRDGVRLLVPIVSVLDDVDAETGADKSSHMASVSLVQADGRRGLLAFTGVETMSLWDPAARPVPVTAYDVAAAAVAEGADGVLVDIAGPVRFAVDGELLADLAALSLPPESLSEPVSDPGGQYNE
ncbi:MAG: hypothetical protein RL134_2197 [Actinomycetota bacterium]